MNAETVLELARQKNYHIAAAESCTGGLLSAMLTDIPGASDVFDRGLVTYSNSAKTELLGVHADTIHTHGAVSEEVAWEMAEGMLKNAPVQLAIAVTGLAGPGGSGVKPEGLVCFGLAQQGRRTRTESVEFGAMGRDAVRYASVMHAFGLLADAMS